MKFIAFCNKIIEYGFYTLFLLIPIAFNSSTSELFEFNKMWLTFGITIVIGAAWLTKSVLQKHLAIQRTPLDIPIALFLLSQIISSIFSLDSHVSWWGYYSRFNGGLLSTITYIFLYYAFVSNLTAKHALRMLTVSLFCGLIVSLWGFPSHFGYDPTCFVFRGTLDTSCWTDAFRPTIRSFSTLGQPAWFAAYLALLLPISLAYFLKTVTLNNNGNWQMEIGKWKDGKWKIIYFLLSLFFYANLLFANTRAGLIAFWIANLLFWTVIFFKKIFPPKTFLKYIIICNLCFILLNFIFGGPIGPLEKFTLPRLTAYTTLTAHAQTPTAKPPKTAQPIVSPSINITDSGQIRLLVWRGAIAAWKANPVFGTGVETFAYAYYQYRPKEHNLTSEWDYLYNKAHNEYLNYLTTTGAFGLGTYLLIIIFFTLQFLKYVFFSQKETTNNQKMESENLKTENGKWKMANGKWKIVPIALFAAYLSILISNFFGFSIVIINLYFFLIPAVFFTVTDLLPGKTVTIPFLSNHTAPKHTPSKNPTPSINIYQWILLIGITLFSGYLVLQLLQYWYADTAYALGNNLDKVGSYQEAYPKLVEAVTLEPDEPVYKDELAVNLATLASALLAQKDKQAATTATQFAQNAVALNNEVTTNHPNNVIFLKNRVRIFYSLAQSDPKNQQAYLTQALQAMQKANHIAPTDAKISYNLGILYGQTGNIEKAIDTLKQTIYLKPDYRDAYYALALFYHEQAIDKNGTVTNPAMAQKAEETMQYILTHISATDQQTKDTLNQWKK